MLCLLPVPDAARAGGATWELGVSPTLHPALGENVVAGRLAHRKLSGPNRFCLPNDFMTSSHRHSGRKATLYYLFALKAIGYHYYFFKVGQ